MNAVVNASICLLGLMFIVSGITCLMTPKIGLTIAQVAGAGVFVLFIAGPFIVEVFSEINTPTAVFLVSVSVVASYVVRERRHPRRAPRKRPPGGERKPVMPLSRDRDEVDF